MLTRSLLKSFRTPSTYSPFKLHPFPASTFCTWKPNVPKHELQLDGTSYCMIHPVWDREDIKNITQTHFEPQTTGDKVALKLTKTLRRLFDYLTFYKMGQMNEERYIRRFLCHEIIAGVPGMVGGMIRHMKSLSRMYKDGGWIHHQLEEAENERIHLFTFMDIRKPNFLIRMGILGLQAFFVAFYAAMYAISPKIAHRFVGYLKEEAIKTYTHGLEDLEAGKLPGWENLGAPKVARRYWKMDENAKFKDVLLNIRADETLHREMNHHFASLKPDEKVQKFSKIVVVESDQSKQ